jgi:DNA-directed RNA polymerase specialized sigma24 family protein
MPVEKSLHAISYLWAIKAAVAAAFDRDQQRFSPCEHSGFSVDASVLITLLNRDVPRCFRSLREEGGRPRSAEVVRYRFFFSMTLEEVAKQADCSVATVQRELAYARAFSPVRASH